MKKKTRYPKMEYPKTDTMGDILSPAMVPQPGDDSTKLYSNDYYKQG